MSSKPLKKSSKKEEKENFQSLFIRNCIRANAAIIPVGNVLLQPYRDGIDVIPSSGAPKAVCYNVFNENYEKEGTIQQVIFKRMNFDVIVLESMQLAMNSYDTISDLRLYNCNLNCTGIIHLSMLLQAHNSVKDLTVDENPNNRQNFYLLFRNNNIQHISLQRCRINKKGVLLISKELRQKNKLLSLDLSHNYVCDDAMKYLADGIQVNRSLLILILVDNWFGDVGVKFLMKVLKKFQLTREEIQDIRKGNLRNELKKLELKQKSFTDSIIEKKNGRTSRKSVDLIREKSNKLDRVSLKSSKRSVKSNRRSKEVFKAEGTEYVHENGTAYCLGNLRLAYLNVSYNKITEMGLEYIHEVLCYQRDDTSILDGLSYIVLNGIIANEESTQEKVLVLLKRRNSLLRKTLP